MPWIFIGIFIVGDMIAIPGYEWYLLIARRRQITETGFANYFQLCGMMQVAFIILVVYQLFLAGHVTAMVKKVEECKQLLAENPDALLYGFKIEKNNKEESKASYLSEKRDTGCGKLRLGSIC
jgi:hypothetical protein